MNLMKTIDFMRYLQQYLDDYLPENAFYSDVFDISKEKALAVYRSPNEERIGLNDIDPITNAGFSIRIRWGKDTERAEENAFAIYEKIKEIEPGTNIGGHLVSCVLMGHKNGEPERVGMDDNGVIEYLIEVSIYYFK